MSDQLVLKIAIVNVDTDVPAAEIVRVAAALTRQGLEHVAPHWGMFVARAATAANPPHPDEAVMELRKVPDQPGALGDHDLTPAGMPLMRVFPALCAQDNTSWSSCASHEACEARADERLTWLVQLPDGRIAALEVCLSGDTEIVLASGARARIDSLTGSDDVWVRSADDNGRPVVAEATRIRRTRHDAPIVVVRLSNGRSVRCTADHRFLLDDLTYRAASELSHGDRLLPAGTRSSALDCGVRDSIAFGEDASAVATGADERDRRGVKPRCSVPVAARDTPSAHALLDHGVSDVVVLHAQKQVIRPDASGHVAAMAHEHPVGDRPELHLVRHAMGGFRHAANAKLAVSEAVRGASPQPTSSGLLDVNPEALFDGRASVIVGAPGRGQGLDGSVIAHSLPVGAAEPLGAMRPDAACDGAMAFHPVFVDTVEDAGKADVFDLAVPATRNVELAAGVYVHNCDQVEADAYLIDGVEVSNFNTPANFTPAASDAPGDYDYLGKQTRPFEVRPGGYAQVFDPARGWIQLGTMRPYRARLASLGLGRGARRAAR